MDIIELLNRQEIGVVMSGKSLFFRQQVHFVAKDCNRWLFIVHDHSEPCRVSIDIGNVGDYEISCECMFHDEFCKHAVASLLYIHHFLKNKLLPTIDDIILSMKPMDKDLLLKSLLLKDFESLYTIAEPYYQTSIINHNLHDLIKKLNQIPKNNDKNAGVRRIIQTWFDNLKQVKNTIHVILTLQQFLELPNLFVDIHTADQTQNIALMDQIQKYYWGCFDHYVQCQSTESIAEIIEYIIGYFYRINADYYDIDTTPLYKLLKLSYHSTAKAKLTNLITDLQIAIYEHQVYIDSDIFQDYDESIEGVHITVLNFELFMVDYYLNQNKRFEAENLLKNRRQHYRFYHKYITYLIENEEFTKASNYIFKPPKIYDESSYQDLKLLYYEATKNYSKVNEQMKHILTHHLTLDKYIQYKPFLNEEEINLMLQDYLLSHPFNLDPLVDVLIYESHYNEIIELLKRYPIHIRKIYDKIPTTYTVEKKQIYEYYLNSLLLQTKEKSDYKKLLYEIKKYHIITNESMNPWLEKIKTQFRHNQSFIRMLSKMDEIQPADDNDDELPF